MRGRGYQWGSGPWLRPKRGGWTGFWGSPEGVAGAPGPQRNALHLFFSLLPAAPRPHPPHPPTPSPWSFRWSERAVTGSPPADARQRRCLAALPDGRRLLVLGGPVTDTVHAFDYASRTWTVLAASGGPGGSDWQFGGALLRGRSVFMFGAAALPPAGREAPVEVGRGWAGWAWGGWGGQGVGGVGLFVLVRCVGKGAACGRRPVQHPLPTHPPLMLQLWELSLKTMAWTRVSTRGTPLPYRIHAAHAAVGPRWVVAGGRRPGRFNVTADAWEFDFDTMR